jgi:protein phosphatase
MLGDNPSLSSIEEDSSDRSVPAAITDIGCEREINEDRYAVIDSSVGRAWIVCDGMGGCLGGELAAQLAIDAIRRALESQDFDSSNEALRFSIEEANRIIVLRRQNPAFSSMGTTVVCGRFTSLSCA